MAINFNDDKAKQKIAEVEKRQQEESLQHLADQLGFPYVTLFPNAVEGDALRLVPEDKARAAKLLPFKIENKKFYVALRDPKNKVAVEILKSLKAAGYEIIIHIVSDKTLEECFENYKNLSFATASATDSVDITNEALTGYIGKVKTITDVRNILDSVITKKDSRLSQILEIILSGAIATSASDIHIEPEEHNVRLRYRLDGMLYDVSTFDNKIFRLILSRIKLISGLKLNIKAEAQDGRFSILAGGDEIEIRTSIVPGGYGESIVLRVLNPKSLQSSLVTLGINEHLLAITKEIIKRPQGMLLNTGPTGSGKTTTLYTFLRTIYTPEVKILTIEDPIEYRLQGIVQTQVDEEKGYTFLEGLRSVLRQDPDIIMIGEIRDEETARTAIDAALTGHLVFSTLHTNNAAGAFTRLIDLGVNPKVITSAVSMAMAQRLVRKLCPICRKEVKIDGSEKELVEKIVESIKKKASFDYKGVMWVSVGCNACNNTGYKGRIGIYEAILSNGAIEAVVRQNPSEREIKKAAEPQNIFDMREDGIFKVLTGIISLEELKRVVDVADIN